MIYMAPVSSKESGLEGRFLFAGEMLFACAPFTGCNKDYMRGWFYVVVAFCHITLTTYYCYVAYSIVVRRWLSHGCRWHVQKFSWSLHIWFRDMQEERQTHRHAVLGTAARGEVKSMQCIWEVIYSEINVSVIYWQTCLYVYHLSLFFNSTACSLHCIFNNK